MNWKSLPYWVIGGMWSALVTGLPVLLLSGIGLLFNGDYNSIWGWGAGLALMIFVLPGSLIFGLLLGGYFDPWSINIGAIIASVIFYFLVGALISMFKNRKTKAIPIS